MDKHNSDLDADRTASGRSLWWAVVAIVLNTYLQKSGSICALDSSYEALAAASPIVRLLDAACACLELLWCLRARRNRSLAEAARLVVANRFADASADDDGGSSGSSGSSRVPEAVPRWLRPVVFALGALPQYVKVFAIEGVPWTQAWAGMYLASFMVVECFLWACRGPGHPLARMGTNLGVVESSDLDRRRMRALFSETKRKVAFYGFALQMGVAWWTFAQFSGIYLLPHEGMVINYIMNGFHAFCFFPLSFTVVMWSTAIFLHFARINLEPTAFGVSWWLFMLFLSTFSYYNFVYDPKSTYKAPWLENLG